MGVGVALGVCVGVGEPETVAVATADDAAIDEVTEAGCDGPGLLLGLLPQLAAATAITAAMPITSAQALAVRPDEPGLRTEVALADG